jgi:hypothetical protein
MKPIYVAASILLALTLCFALIGMFLVNAKKIKLQKAAGYCRVSTALVLASAYGLTVFDWPGVHLRQLDFWSLMVILGIAAYALIWGAVAYQLNKGVHQEFGESFMLSMLYTDAEHPQQKPPPQNPEQKPGKPDAH